MPKGRHCYDGVRLDGWFYTLSIAERPNGRLRIAVQRWDERFELGVTVHSKVIASSNRWPDVHLEVEDDRLFVIWNGKRCKEIVLDD